MIDLSLIINTFRENRLLHPTLVNLRACVDVARSRGWEVEVVLVCDRTDSATYKYIDDFASEIFSGIPLFQLTVDNGDLGLSRNDGVSFARGRLIALSDADNLYSANWLAEGIAALSGAGDGVVVHPEYMVQFGATNLLWKTPTSEGDSFDPRGIVEHNYWDAASIAPRELFERIPFAPSMAGPGFGPEDWQWNAEVLAAGFAHRVVPETALFYRVKSSGSLLSTHMSSKSILAPTSLLRRLPVGREHHTGSLLTDSEHETQSASSANLVESRRRQPPRTILLRATRGVARPIAKVLVPFFKRAARVHPRVEVFGKSVLGALRALFAAPAVENISEKPVMQTAAAVSEPVPQWLLDEWKRAHLMEPEIFPDWETLSSLARWSPRAGLVSDAYWDLVSQVLNDNYWQPDFVFLIPWFAPGGGTRVLLNYIAAIRQSEPGANVLILSTHPPHGGPSDRSGLDEDVRHVEMPAAFHKLPSELQDRVLATFLVQFQPRVIHLINSHAGYRVLKSYSRPLAHASRLFVSLFTIDRSPEGRHNHYFLDGVRDFFDNLTGVFTDNQPIVDRMVGLFGLPQEKFVVHYQPISAEAPATHPATVAVGHSLRVIWAARFDRQKRPDVFLRVVASTRALSLPVDFFVSGMPVLDDVGDLYLQLEAAGVKNLGPFNETIATLNGGFDALLLTSEWEGLPLTILDAAVNNIAVIAPAVGGIPDFVRDGETGYLVNQFDDVDAYVDVLAKMLVAGGALTVVTHNARDLATTRHRWPEFYASLSNVRGYLK